MIRAGVAVSALTIVAVLVGRLWRLEQARDVVVAVARAFAQLAAVGLVVAAVFRTPVLAPAYLTVVLTAASWTSGRRIGPLLRPGAAPSPRGDATLRLSAVYAIAAVSIAAGTTVAGGIVMLTGALAPEARTAVPFLAQLAGGSMTATTLAGQRLRDDVTAGWADVEAWLALGATPSQAAREFARRAAARALVPAIDQTRNVGLVVLPGAYVGLLLAGAAPIDAGRLQLLVLVALLAAETTAAVLTTRMLAPRFAAARPAARQSW